MSGFDVARYFRTALVLQDASIVALTGWGGPDDRRRTRGAGFDMHLTKPARLSDVDGVLSQYATLSSERRAINATQAG